MGRNNRGLVILTAILAVIVLGLGGYLVYDKVLVSKNTLDKEKIKDELQYYFHYFGGCDYGLELDFTKKDRLYFSDLDNKIIYNVLYNYLDKNKLIKTDKTVGELGAYETEFN